VPGVSTSGGTDLSYFNPRVVSLIDPGTITKGTAGAVKSYRVTVAAKNAAGATASAAFTWRVTG
jgi:hypothetical protein